MSEDNAPAPGVHLFYLDDAGVLFSERRQELHLLNETATLIFSLLEEGHDEVSAARELQALTGIDAPTSAAHVATALREWRSKGLLGRSAAPRVEASPAAGPAFDAPWAPSQVVGERTYKLLDTPFRIRFTSAEQIEVVHPIVEHLELPEPAPEAITIDVVGRDGRQLVYRDREPFAECKELCELAPFVKALFWQSAVNRHDYFLDIHAGVVGDDRRCILLPAAAGSGKSTLTAALVHDGFAYYSDEVALLEENTLAVYPVPLAICVKVAGLSALVERFPVLHKLPVHRRIDGKDVIYMAPPAGALPSGTHPRPVVGVVFPRYSRDALTSIEPLSAAEALKCLLEECLVIPKGLAAGTVQALIRWILRIPCYRLTFGSTDEAVAAVKGVFRQGTSSG
ncbi:MAG TPA: PqqD family peptide modification chaperone [Casimicrobiaceae bacterium]|nr:PqqD family peptide modification chaperone [Casimicrobiaceae bacterium]